MKRIKFLFVITFLMVSTNLLAQGVVKGFVVDASTGSPLAGVNILEVGTYNGVVTDFDGNFSIKVSTQTGELELSYIGFTSQILPFDVTNGDQDLGTISLELGDSLDEIILIGTGVIDLAEDRKTPIAVSTVKGDDIQLKAAGNSEFTETIKNVPSVYVANQSGGFGDSQVFLRGFDDTNTAYLLNGQPINSMEDGRIFWSNWAGMSDVANAVQVQRGLGSSKLAISSVGGTVNIVSKTTDQSEGGYVRFLGGNDSYLKGTVAYNTGLSDNGWAFSVLLDHWQAHRKYAEGTAGQGQNYLLSFGYKPNDQHAFNFLVTGAPQWHDQNFSQNLEVFERFGEKHNRNSGFLDGERYTERRNYYHKPVANLNWDFDINDDLELSTVLYASWGRGGGTGGLGRGRVRVDDDGDQNIDFEQIRTNNRALPNQIGSFGDSYIRRASVNNHNWYGLLSNLNIVSSEALSFNVGFDTRLYHGDHFRQVNDLLGLTAFQDAGGTDRPDDYQFTEEFEANPWAALFDFADEENRAVFDYSEDINYIGTFGQVEYSTDQFSVFFQGAVSTQSYQREGRFVGTGNGLGKSDKINKAGFNLKGGFSYNINEQNAVFINSGFFSRQPFLDNVFADIRNSNDLVSPEVDNEEITGLEAGYRFKGDFFRFNLDVYHTIWDNRFLSFAGPNEGDDETTYRLLDVTQVHQGVEFDFEYRPEAMPVTFRGFGSIGNWEFDGETPYTQTNDNTAEIIAEDVADLSDVKVGRSAQTSFGVGAIWQVTPDFSLDSDFNYYADQFGQVDVRAIVEDTFDKEELDAYSLLDAGATYKFSIGGDRLTLRANVKNVFNDSYISQRGARGYFLGIGRTWNASLRYSF